MALNPNEIFTDGAERNPGLRFFPTVLQPKEFASSAGAETLPVGTAVAFNTSTNKWQVLDGDGMANDVEKLKGFVWPDPITLDADEEVLGQVMLEGRVHRDDIPVVTDDAAATYTQNELDAQLRTVARSLNITVEGLTQVR